MEQLGFDEEEWLLVSHDISCLTNPDSLNASRGMAGDTIS
jgi:hypothetical protein